MAIDLGISPHAVEKRLKMARAKLGLASSLQAARLLAEAEGYRGSGPQISDLALSPPDSDDPAFTGIEPCRVGGVPRWIRLAGLWGLVPMMIAIGLLALAVRNSGQVPVPSANVQLPVIQTASHPSGDVESVDDIKMRAASPAEIRAFVRSSFAIMDKDHSGFIEQPEAPSRGIGFGQPHRERVPSGEKEAMTYITGTAGQALWISNGDKDRDGRMSEEEYLAWMLPIWAARGSLPVGWVPQR